MKRENLREAQSIISRLELMEAAYGYYNDYKSRECSKFMLFVKPFRYKKHLSLEVGYNHDYSIGLSKEQQEELAELLKKWIAEDKQKLETL